MLTKEQIKAMEEELQTAFAAENIFAHPELRYAVAKKMQVVIEKGYIKKDLESLLCVTDDFKLGETPQWVTPKGATSAVLAEGATVIISPPENTTVDGTPQLNTSTPSMQVDQLRAGRYGDVKTQQRNGRDALLWRKNKDIWDLVKDSVTAGDGYGEAASTSTSAIKTALDKIVDYVGDTCPDEGVAIIGRRSIVSKISDFNTNAATLDIFPEEIKREYMNKGVLSVYRGLPVIAISKMRDSNGTLAISNSDILVIGKNAVRFGRIKYIEMIEWINPEVAGGGQWNVKFEEKYALGVPDTSYNGRLHLT